MLTDISAVRCVPGPHDWASTCGMVKEDMAKYPKGFSFNICCTNLNNIQLSAGFEGEHHIYGTIITPGCEEMIPTMLLRLLLITLHRTPRT